MSEADRPPPPMGPPPEGAPAAAGAPATPHYFAARPEVRSSERVVPLVLPDLRLDLVTDRGTFSHGGIDPGTKLLLLEAPLPAPEATTIVDLGAGYGPIALALARRRPGAQVWAVEVNERALELCRRNAVAAGAANVVAVRPDEVPEGFRAQAVYSNPPIRVGKAALHALLETWLGRLAPGGRMFLVVHRHLGADSLQHWLGTRGHAVERLRSRAGYRLLAVDGPR